MFSFFNDPAPTAIYTLSLHDALPISFYGAVFGTVKRGAVAVPLFPLLGPEGVRRSEEHTSELQSRVDLVCRLLLEKKKTNGHEGAALCDDVVTTMCFPAATW